MVLKRGGVRQPFLRAKIVAGMRAATKNLPVASDELDSIAAEIEEQVRLVGQEVSSSDIGQMVLTRLRHLDEVAYMRFASVYKVFKEPGDFERELGLLAEPDPSPESPPSEPPGPPPG